MMVMTAKVDFKKIILILAAAAALILAVILLLGGNEDTAAAPTISKPAMTAGCSFWRVSDGM